MRKRGKRQAAAVQGGVAVQRGLANLESSTSDAPLLSFKSDKAFLTAGEVARKAAAAAELQGALVQQARASAVAERIANTLPALSPLSALSSDHRNASGLSCMLLAA
jgi:hypothetical protein